MITCLASFHSPLSIVHYLRTDLMEMTSLSLSAEAQVLLAKPQRVLPCAHAVVGLQIFLHPSQTHAHTHRGARRVGTAERLPGNALRFAGTPSACRSQGGDMRLSEFVHAQCALECARKRGSGWELCKVLLVAGRKT